jgi:ferredoxin--NADP+ reductase
MFKIVRREEISQSNVVLNVIDAPLIAKKAKPGQFVILKANETGERIPLTIADSDPEKGTIAVIYMVVGKTTLLFKELKVGDGYQDVIGPLGREIRLSKLGTVVCVGGGTGVAVLYPITRGLKQVGNRVISIIGARHKSLLILENRMNDVSHEFNVCTDDGSHGHKGFVTDVLKDVLEKEDVKLVVGIGPIPMMKAVCQVTKEKNVKTLVSLNPIMIDGTGMCGGCRVTVGGETKFACVDGPEFDGHQVDFDELLLRLQAYEEDEIKSRDEHVCNLKTRP